MKILAALTYYYPHWTGLTAYAKRIAEGLVERGHDVTVLTTRPSKDLPLHETHNGVQIVRVDPVARLSRGVISPAFPKEANRLIAQSDVVQIHTPLLESALVAGLCRRHNVPLLITHHGDLVMPDGFFNQAVERVMVAQMTFAERMASAISIHSQDYAEHSDFLWPFADKLHFIYPPVVMPEPQLDVVKAWRAELGLTDKKLVGFAGRFVEEKGFDYLLQAIPLVLEQIPEAHFVYAGEHNVVYEDFFDQWKHLIDHYREHITFVGLIKDQQKLANFYAMPDVFTIPSRTDCFPSVQIEAMLSGTPLVTANIPGAREVIMVTNMGKLVKPRNPQALAEGLIEVLRCPKHYTKLRAEIANIFNPTRTIDQYEALMAEIAHQPKPEPLASITNHRLHAEPSADSLNRPTAQQTWLTNGTHAITPQTSDPTLKHRSNRLLDYLEIKSGDTVLNCTINTDLYTTALTNAGAAHVVTLKTDHVNAKATLQSAQNSPTYGDIEHLSFADHTFDRIVVSEVLARVFEDRKALRELWRVLKPGGVLAISVPHRNYPLWWDPIARLWTAVGGEPLRRNSGSIWHQRQRLYRPHELQQRVIGAGFTVEQCEETNHYAVPLASYLVHRLESAAEIVGWHKIAYAMLMTFDRLNQHPRVNAKSTFTHILLKARKTEEGWAIDRKQF